MTAVLMQGGSLYSIYVRCFNCSWKGWRTELTRSTTDLCEKCKDRPRGKWTKNINECCAKCGNLVRITPADPTDTIGSYIFRTDPPCGHKQEFRSQDEFIKEAV